MLSHAIVAGLRARLGDADWAITTGEMGRMIDSLICALGGDAAA